jgi:hypothetical protein
MLQNRKMRAMNTFFKAAEDKDEETEKLTTWRSMNGKQKGQIDYINIDTHKANWVERIDYIGNANPRSNNGHKAIMMTIRQRRKKEPKEEKELPQHVKYDIMKMRKEYENQKYRWEKIHEKIRKVKETKMSIKKETDRIWEKIETEIRKQIIKKNVKKKKKEEEELNDEEKEIIKKEEEKREKIQKDIETYYEEREIERKKTYKK